MDEKGPFCRSNSICPTPQSILLNFVRTNDVRNLRRLVSTNPTLLSYVYKIDLNKPILLIACTEVGIKPETIEALIDLGADLNYASPYDEEWEAIHFAASRTNSQVLKVLVKNCKVNSLAKGNNALHVLVKHGDHDSEEFVKCAEVLISSGIDVNQGDEKNVSAIFWAAKKEYKDFVKLLLDQLLINVDLDSHKLRGKTARSLIEERNLYEGTLPPRFNPNSYDRKKTLFSYLKSSNETAFINYNNGDIIEMSNMDDSDNTLLQLACDKGLTQATEHLLDKGADPNLSSEKNGKHPIEIACEHGFYNIVDLLLKHPHTAIPKKLLINLLKDIDNEKFPGKDHEKCYENVVGKLNVNNNMADVNFSDEYGNTALHYSVRYAEGEKTLQLLKLNASLASKNIYDTMPIESIEPELLEKHLDACIEFDTKTKSIEKEDFAVTFNYRSLIPPVPQKELCTAAADRDPEPKYESFSEELVKETDVVFYMSKAPEFRHLLKHPLVVSFLFMKWHRVRWLFYVNLLFYVTFFAALVVYIFASFANEAKTPIVNFAVYVSHLLFAVTFCVLVLRELFQVVVSTRKYLVEFENYIELVLILVAGCILSSPNADTDYRRQLSAIAILLSAFELILMVGQHPKLSTNVVMLKTVSFNFFKFLLWYSLLIVAFALSFFILFTNPTAAEAQNATTNNEEEDLFTDPGKSVFKTIIMLTGEFDAGSLNFRHFPVLSKLIFALFIFMIAIILLNLLNGLAVSDTQMIKNDAELVGHIARAQHIHYVESMLLGNIFPEEVVRLLQNICCCIPDREVIVVRPLAERSCLFPRYLHYEMTVYPNKKGEVDLPKNSRNRRFWFSSCAPCHKIYLDKDTVRRTNRIIQEKRDKLKIKKVSTHLDERIEYLLKIQQDNKEKLDLIIENFLSDKFHM